MSELNMEILELLASKICHDLISPIGAVNNGLEIFEEMGPDAGEDVTDLIAFSAGQASAKLKAFRMAYGAGGADGNISTADVHACIQDIVGPENKIVQQWQASDRVAPEMPPRGFCKILISTLMLAKECLPRGGALNVTANGDTQTVVTAQGQGANVKEGFAECLKLTMNQADLKTSMTHAYVMGLLAKHYGFQIEAHAPESDNVAFIITYPSF